MRGLEKAYNTIMKEVDKFYSKEEMVKRAKKKLVGNQSNDFEVMRCDVDTQDYVTLICNCDANRKSYRFGLSVPVMEDFGFLSSSLLDNTNEVSFNTLKEELNKHRSLCKSNIVSEFGNLKIGYYNYKPITNFLVGLVDDEIVFIFEICTDYIDIDIMLEDELLLVTIPFFGNTKVVAIKVEDYSVVNRRRF